MQQVSELATCAAGEDTRFADRLHRCSRPLFNTCKPVLVPAPSRTPTASLAVFSR